MYKIIFGLLLTLGFALLAAWFWWLHVPQPPQPALGGAFDRHVLEVDGHQRTFATYRPAGDARDLPIVFVLHGSAGDGDRMRRATAHEFDVLAQTHGLLVVYPDGFEGHWNDCRGTADYSANRLDVNDPLFFERMVQELAAHHGGDARRVFATGISNGGHMAFRLALERPDLVQAVAPMAANLPAAEYLDCEETGAAVPVAIFNGTADPVNPYEGGVVEIMGNTSRGVVRSASETADYFVQRAGIAVAPRRIEHPQTDGVPETSVIEQRWSGAAGMQVRLYTLVGSGHVIPSRIARFPRLLGVEARDLSGAEEAVRFFLEVSPPLQSQM